jgi:hypothetical protein
VPKSGCSRAVVFMATMVNPAAVWFNAARLTVAPVPATVVKVTV